MRAYLDLLRQVLEHGERRTDRTGTGTLSLFGMQARFDLREGFPLVTTKKVIFESVKKELLWFLRGETNIQSLGCGIWDAWARPDGELGPIYGHQWRRWGEDLARERPGFDQIARVVDQIRRDPSSRRLIVSAWNAPEIEQMALAPCHALFQFYVAGGASPAPTQDEGHVAGGASPAPTQDEQGHVAGGASPAPTRDAGHVVGGASPAPTRDAGHGAGGASPAPTRDEGHVAGGASPAPTRDEGAFRMGEARRLDLQLYQRSADLAVGVPFNIASYALLLMLVAKATGLTPGYFVHTFGDAHIYLNHVEGVRVQLEREPLPLPRVVIHGEVDLSAPGAMKLTPEDIELVDYRHHAFIKFPIAV